MAVTLPLALAAYEWFYYRTRTRGPVLALASVPDLAYAWGKFFGADPLASQPGYGPVIFFNRLIDFQRLMFCDVFLNWHYAGWPAWLAVALLAVFRRQKLCRFCWLFSVVIAPLPIEFLQGRGAACLGIRPAPTGLSSARCCFGRAA